jgi:hypothetical protein
MSRREVSESWLDGLFTARPRTLKQDPGVLARVTTRDSSSGVLARITTRDSPSGVLTRVTTRDSSSGILARVTTRDSSSGVLARVTTRDISSGVLARVTRDSSSGVLARVTTRDSPSGVLTRVTTRDSPSGVLTRITTRDSSSGVLARVTTRDSSSGVLARVTTRDSSSLSRRNSSSNPSARSNLLKKCIQMIVICCSCKKSRQIQFTIRTHGFQFTLILGRDSMFPNHLLDPRTACPPVATPNSGHPNATCYSLLPLGCAVFDVKKMPECVCLFETLLLPPGRRYTLNSWAASVSETGRRCNQVLFLHISSQQTRLNHMYVRANGSDPVSLHISSDSWSVVSTEWSGKWNNVEFNVIL